EYLRTQGTAWYIKELPTLVLNGSKHGILLTEVDEPTPLKKYRGTKTSDLELLAIADLFFERNSESIIRLVGETGLMCAEPGPYGTYASKANAGGQSLDWVRIADLTRRPHAVNALSRVLSGLLAQDALQA